MPAKRRHQRQSLNILIQSLTDMEIVVELRNEASLFGRLENCDEYMNLQMANVRWIDSLEGLRFFHELVFINGRQIRYIQIPDSVDPAQIIDQKRKERESVHSFSSRSVRTAKPYVPGMRHEQPIISVASSDGDRSRIQSDA
mmetsp:Transcript_21853/g.36179  ORF Transcript_21853/g.36179 Transcript_21853/m.36179 type:complete len:142 (-) Transcript_21853:774-1199(-)